MFAVVEVAGKQFKVAPKDKILVPSLKNKIGDTLTLDRILMYGEEKEISVGNPLVEGVSIQAKVLDHKKSDKVIVFKKKRRKGYRVKRGHRQGYTEIQITKIGK